MPLQIACRSPELLKQLIAGGADLHKARGVIEKAVYHQCMESIPILVSAGAEINGHSEDFYRPLYTAVRDNLPEYMTKLLQLGANPNIMEGQGSPLLEAACQEDPTRLRILLDAGADLNLQKDGGLTPLMCAAERGALESTKLLLERGANPNVVDGRARTAMEIASERGHDEIVMLLLEAMG